MLNVRAPSGGSMRSLSRLVDAPRIDWKGRAHFLCTAARAMRQILIEHAETAYKEATRLRKRTPQEIAKRPAR